MNDNQGKSYDLIANGFSEMRDSFSTEQKYVDLFMQYLSPGAHILDVGCGSGYPIASYLLEHQFQVTGIDASEKLLKIANSKIPSLKTMCGDMRTITLNEKYDAIIEWWALFHVPQNDHRAMIARFASWLKKGGILEFTTGDNEYKESSSQMLNQELWFYSLDTAAYEECLIQNDFKILLQESDQETHMVWIAEYLGSSHD